jgi:hypothetical protein
MTISIKSVSIFCLSILLSGIFGNILAQSPLLKDACLWQNLYIEKKLFKRITLTNNEEARFDQNITHFKYIYTDVGVQYKVAKWLHISVDYVPILKNNDVSWSKRHQFYLDATLTYKFKQFTFHNRSMFQGQYTDIYSSPTGKIPIGVYRNKTMIKYSYYNFEPYIAHEIFYYLASPLGETGFARTRSFGGVTYTLDQSNSVELYYAIERDFNFNTTYNLYIIGIGYNIIL